LEDDGWLDLHNLGRLYVHQHKLQQAEEAHSQALTLHRQSQSVTEEADDLQDLGRLYMRQNELDNAEEAFSQV
jgi:cytochrome c-type biogenesis protein CcmH/NrfG